MRNFLSYIILAPLIMWCGVASAQTTSEASPFFLENIAIVKRVMDYFDNSGRDETFEKRVDIGALGGVGYSQERGLGLSANLTGAYRLDKSDSLTTASWFSVMASATLASYFSFESAGELYLDKGRHRIDHYAEYSSGYRYLWGRGYDAALNNSKISYLLNSFIAKVEYRYMIVDDFSVGGVFDHRLYRGFHISEPDYIGNESTWLQMAGLGLLVEYDSRDSRHSASNGLYASLKGVAYPKGMGSIDESFYKGYLTLATYHSVWSGGVIAAGLQGEFSTEATPWAMLSSLGDYGFMRGYYIGRFVEDNAISMQVELRQKVWWRLSAAAWVGCGNMYSTLSNFELSETLPNYGVGVRFRASKNSVARFDVGFGRDTIGMFLRYSEAF